ncbi:LexA family transcriptional regulator [Phaeodactylibacter luteus]|uniref:S24 family peptidase n=1 Tax=Phaeodactylibacter luteus TaxID=1564516 RepID=A0A5C6RLX4_9BACT|nr:LexA family transcriptional regulator [Phaeodactylibacter luteus]TXB63253.1 S24 family peptidase [Phaeodactylibacter luteus]
MADFSDHIVNQRFNIVYKELEQIGLIKGKSDIAKHLGTYNHVINSILKGQRNITVDQLYRLFESYSVNANYLFGLSDEMFPDGLPGDIPVRAMGERQSGPRDNITLVPDRALAGYALEHQDSKYLDSLSKFSIPNLEGQLIAFEISGDSMMPTITNGDVVVCDPVERGTPLRDNHVYVVVTDTVVAKRIQQVRDGDEVSSLRLISDNSSVYKPYEVELEEVRQLLKVKCRLTSYAIA